MATLGQSLGLLASDKGDRQHRDFYRVHYGRLGIARPNDPSSSGNSSEVGYLGCGARPALGRIHPLAACMDFMVRGTDRHSYRRRLFGDPLELRRDHAHWLFSRTMEFDGPEESDANPTIGNRRTTGFATPPRRQGSGEKGRRVTVDPADDTRVLLGSIRQQTDSMQKTLDRMEKLLGDSISRSETDRLTAVADKGDFRRLLELQQAQINDLLDSRTRTRKLVNTVATATGIQAILWVWEHLLKGHQ